MNDITLCFFLVASSLLLDAFWCFRVLLPLQGYLHSLHCTRTVQVFRDTVFKSQKSCTVTRLFQLLKLFNHKHCFRWSGPIQYQGKQPLHINGGNISLDHGRGGRHWLNDPWTTFAASPNWVITSVVFWRLLKRRAGRNLFRKLRISGRGFFLIVLAWWLQKSMQRKRWMMRTQSSLNGWRISLLWSGQLLIRLHWLLLLNPQFLRLVNFHRPTKEECWK